MAIINIKNTAGDWEEMPALQGNPDDFINLVYPVGSIYMSVNDVSPSTLFGGSWEKIEDTFLLASGSTFALGQTGGEAEHTLTNAEVPVNAYSLYQHDSLSSEQSSTIDALNNVSVWTNNYREIMNNYNFSGGHPHNNMPPYLAVNIWKRIS